MWTKFNSRLPIALRLSFIVACLLVPISILAYLFVEQSAKDISFAQKEIAGVTYLDRVWPNLVKSAHGENTGQIAGRLEFDQLFNTTKSAAEFENAASPSARGEAGKSLIAAVADGSNLTLDPDLDSFYVGDAVTVRFPGVIAAVEALKVALQETGSDERLIHIAFAINSLTTFANDAAASLQSAIDNNASGETGRSLSQPANDLKVVTAAALAAADEVLARQPAQNLDDVLSKLVVQSDSAWKAANSELGRLLQARVDGFVHSLTLKLGVVIMCLIAAAAALIAVARGITGPLGISPPPCRSLPTVTSASSFRG